MCAGRKSGTNGSVQVPTGNRCQPAGRHGSRSANQPGANARMNTPSIVTIDVGEQDDQQPDRWNPDFYCDDDVGRIRACTSLRCTPPRQRSIAYQQSRWSAAMTAEGGSRSLLRLPPTGAAHSRRGIWIVRSTTRPH